MTELNEAMRKLELPDRIRRLPVSPKGYPVPWFVAWLIPDNRGGYFECAPTVEGAEPDFRIMGAGKISKAHRLHKCWICGEPTGVRKAFVIGPMCAINRISSEPPSHRECAEFAARACPFLTKPRMRRNEDGLEGMIDDPAGIMIKRNPGVALVWITRDYRRVSGGNKGSLFKVGDPEELLWFCEGRTATRAEVLASIESGLPILRKTAEEDGPRALLELKAMTERAMQLVPV